MGVGWLVWGCVLRGTRYTGKFSTAPTNFKGGLNKMIVSTQIQKVKELLALLDPYADLWDEWTSSGACFLTKDDITIVQNFLLTGSHYPSVVELNISLVTAVSRLNKIKLRLEWFRHKHDLWLTERLLTNSGIITYSSPHDYFLNSPFEFLGMPIQLKRKLRLLMVDTMQELLTNYSEEDLRRYRTIGNKTIEDFKVYLAENGCLQLFRMQT